MMGILHDLIDPISRTEAQDTLRAAFVLKTKACARLKEK